jgi:hypothetical protein
VAKQRPTPNTERFLVGQEIMYTGVVYSRKTSSNKKYPVQVISGVVEYVTPFIVGVREPCGQLQTFTDVDIYTGTVKILDERSRLSLILGEESIV